MIKISIPSSVKVADLNDNLIFIVTIIFLSAIAGIFNRNTRTKFSSFRMASIDFFCSVITGFIAYFILIGITGNDWISLGGAAYCGHLGPFGMDYITKRINKYLKMDDD